MVQWFREIVTTSQNPSKHCSKMLRGLEVVKSDDVTQALNQTIQVQPLGPLLGIQLCPSHFHRSSPLKRQQIRRLFAAGAQACASPAHFDCRSDGSATV
jgi:hypothetical protein